MRKVIGFSGSLSVLEIPPLDLKQVEIIKGAASTFYGAGAIAGAVNFISKEPEDAPATSLIFNQIAAPFSTSPLRRPSDEPHRFRFGLQTAERFHRRSRNAAV